MSGTGRTRAPRAQSRRAATEAAPPVAPAIEPSVELLDDHSTAISGGHRGRSLARSMPGAVVGTLLVVGLAMGAALGPGGALGPAGDRSDPKGDTAVAGGDGGPGGGSGTGSYGGTYEGGGDGTKDEYEWEWHGGPDATEKPDVEGPDATEKPDVEPVDEPDATPKPTAKPKPDATPKPVEKPDPTKSPSDPIALGIAIKEYHPVLEWGSCEGLDFDYYKVVRSSDSTATWPAGDGDEVIAAVEQGGTRKAYDKHASHDVKVWYRVFCVRKTEDGYKVVNASATKGIEVPEEPAPPPTPDPISLGLDAWLTDGGKVALDWSACEVDGFAFYKVVRSDWNDDPSYLPWHDGSEVIAAIGEMSATELETSAPESGQTMWYRVQCLGYAGDQKVLLGQSDAVSVTVP